MHLIASPKHALTNIEHWLEQLSNDTIPEITNPYEVNDEGVKVDHLQELEHGIAALIRGRDKTEVTYHALERLKNHRKNYQERKQEFEAEYLQTDEGKSLLDNLQQSKVAIGNARKQVNDLQEQVADLYAHTHYYREIPKTVPRALWEGILSPLPKPVARRIDSCIGARATRLDQLTRWRAYTQAKHQLYVRIEEKEASENTYHANIRNAFDDAHPEMRKRANELRNTYVEHKQGLESNLRLAHKFISDALTKSSHHEAA